MNVYQIDGVVNLVEIENKLGFELDPVDVKNVTWGDANYTLVDLYSFWRHCIRDNPQLGFETYADSYSTFLEMLGEHPKFVNLEDM